jgi:hypothetical protein
MACQYSIRGLVSRGKRNRALKLGAGDRGGEASDIAIDTVIMGYSRVLPESLTNHHS